MTTEEIHVPILIVGGGPVGLQIAIELGLWDVGCLLVNDQAETSDIPKVGTISARTMEHFRRTGVAPLLRREGLPANHPTDVVCCTRFSGHELARMPQAPNPETVKIAARGEGAWPTPEPPLRASQILEERCQKERAEDLAAVDLRFGWRLESFEQGKDCVHAHAIELATGNAIDIRADYMVGADGGNGIVRPQLGYGYVGESGVVREFLGGTMYFVYFEATRDPAWYGLDDAWMFWVLNPEMRAVMLHVDSPNRFILHTAVKPGTDVATLDPDWHVRTAAGVDFPYKKLAVSTWTAGFCLVTEHYQQDRVFLCGDSAHLFTPAGGNGMNTGVDDAVNLAWKLAAVCQGWGGPGLLATYEQERRPIGVRNTEYARDLARWVGNMKVPEAIEADTAQGREDRARMGVELEEFMRTEYLVPGLVLGIRYDASDVIVFDDGARPPDEAATCVPVGCPGMRAPHFWLEGGVSLFDRMGHGFTLMKLGNTSASTAAIENAAAARGIPLRVLETSDAAMRDAYERDLVLVRPDQHVAWRGNQEPPDGLALFDKLTGA